ncbi:hypothetical protein PVOR_07040 [Paenibacillus vortex V453]|uniref:Uncharacterized protein n=1 Tax=Paenibacillus vortex V453 TaxID=715225 RepID=A0A2R9SZ20_9BACL|nr:hypothetical protein [Paenibacillus vortex]EFU42591.1 hypothetical protein PVOR_07040 [Paenibacillus vortex V453]
MAAQAPFRDLEPGKAAKEVVQVPFRDLEPEQAAVMVHLILHYESFMQ